MQHFEAEPWQARCEALLPILQAAINITHGSKFLLRGKGDSVLIPCREYEALYEAVESYRLAAEREQKHETI